MQHTLETLDTAAVVAGIDAAIRVIATQRMQLAHGSLSLWNKLNHAENYLDKQIAQLMAPEAE